jgi:tetratricopeptide (TPR) repeat protein
MMSFRLENRMKEKLCLCLLLCVAALPAVAADEGHHHELSVEQLGAVSFPTSCSHDVQKPFERGVAWLHSFEYEQAGKQFEEVEAADPKCAMAYWGEAMALYHQLWTRPTAGDVKSAQGLLEHARQLAPRTERERDYVAALAVFYASGDPKQFTARVKAYSAAMDKLHQKYPSDREAAVFYALSLLALDDDTDPNLTLARQAVAILNQQLKGAPEHPGITHYIIHATDNPQLAAQGLAAARAYAKIAPASTHAVHMPSHIFARLGLWQDDIASNTAALKIADRMSMFHMAHHRIHSMEFLEYAYLQIGDDVHAKQQVDALLAMPGDAIDSEYVDYYQQRLMNFQATYAIERRQWQEALALKADPAAVPFAQGVVAWAHAVAAGHLHEAAAAKAAAEQYLVLIEAQKQSSKPYLAHAMENGRDEALAWAKHAEGDDVDAVRLLRAVADKQDKVGKGEVELPAREMLADLLLDAGRPAEALREYEISLQTDPNRFNALAGAARAAELAKQPQKAADYYAQVVKNCSGSSSERPELAKAKSVVAAPGE